MRRALFRVITCAAVIGLGVACDPLAEPAEDAEPPTIDGTIGAGGEGGEGGQGGAGGEAGQGGEGGGGGDCRDVPSLEPGNRMYGRYEGTTGDNACRVDADCMRSGCSGEICAAESLASTCEVVAIPDGDCGCVEGVCIWHVDACGGECRDADGDRVCDREDFECNADGTPLGCRRAAPPCPEGTVPEVRDGCYTDRCVTWEECGSPAPAQCGGLAGVRCPEGQRCVDDPSDDCDPDRGGDDCIGICVPAPAMCGGIAGIECAEGQRCVDDPSDDCNPERGGADCAGICVDGPAICGGIAGLRCPEGQRCVDDPDDGCDPARGGADCAGICVDAPAICGGIAGLRCPEGQRCVDDPDDGCDPARGGADCAGICVDAPAACAPVEDGEYGACERVLGYGVNARGECVAVSGCACDETCRSRVFDTVEACQAACAEPACRDTDGDRICDREDPLCNADGTALMCRIVGPACIAGTVPEIRNGCFTQRCVSWAECGDAPAPQMCGGFANLPCPEGERCVDDPTDDCNPERGGADCPGICVDGAPEPQQCGGFANLPCPEGQQCADDPRDDCVPERGGADCPGICVDGPMMCAPIREAEFGLCEAFLGWGVLAATGACGPVSGCGCDERCEGRVFRDEAECQRACGGVDCRDSDRDGRCDAVDPECNADGTPLMCRRAPPACRAGTVPEVREGCYTDRCLPWDRCGEPLPEPGPAMCGGFAGFLCPEGEQCFDDPRDDCDPARGAADCIGVCVDDAAVCSPVAPGEYGDCRAVLGYARSERGCAVVSGCACDLTCVGRVFPDEATCLRSCLR